MVVKTVKNTHAILMIVVRHGIVVIVNIINGGEMKDTTQDNRVCLFYVANKLFKISRISDRRKMETAIEEFKRECIYNLGIDALHNHNN